MTRRQRDVLWIWLSCFSILAIVVEIVFAPVGIVRSGIEFAGAAVIAYTIFRFQRRKWRRRV